MWCIGLFGLFGLSVGCRSVAMQPAVPIDGPANGSLDAETDSALADGAPVRLPCTDVFGDALTQSYGRLDGILVAIVLPNARGCRGDDNHLHLQISAAAAIYDIAVNIGEADPATNDVHSTEHDLALIGPPWSEGWHLDVAPADYTLLGVHAGDLPLHSQADNTQALVDQLAIANHVSIYATGFGPDGAHLVHRNAGGDGMVVTEPLSPVSHARLFSFTNQTF